MVHAQGREAIMNAILAEPMRLYGFFIDEECAELMAK